jgi:tetratricopeptide (TPR) repeat protein
MSGAGRTAAGVLAAIAAIGAAAATLHARERRASLPPTAARFLYLESDATASRVFLTFKALASDVYWIRAIQHFGHDRKAPTSAHPFELLEPLLNLTTTLDPQFNIAYRFGAIFLSLDPPNGPGRPDRAIALLEKGLAANPRRWQYAHDLGFVHYWYTGQYAEASRWFERAAAIPGAPEWISPLAALTRAKGGDRDGARRLLATLQEAQESYIRDAARRSLSQLQALDAIDQLTAIVDAFHARAGRYPTSWREIIAAGQLRSTPVDPTGVPFALDAETHAVTLSPQSTLLPLPPGLAR